MTLLEKQQVFSVLIAKLILWANEQGYQVTTGEFERSRLQALVNSMTGKGIKNSLHRVKLAADLNLFQNGKYLTKTEDHRPLGKYWESLSTNEYKCRWGGRFGDGNHYSIEHEGRA